MATCLITVYDMRNAGNMSCFLIGTDTFFCAASCQMADVVENEAKMAYMRPSGGSAAAMDEQRGPSKGFVVREAPWATGSEKVSIFLLALHKVCFTRILIFH